MPTSLTNTRLKRLLCIHSVLQKNKNVSSSQLVEACESAEIEVNERLVKADIQLLRELGAPIPKANKHTRFYYEKPFSIIPALEGLDFNEVEELHLYLNQLYKRTPNAVHLGLDRVFLALERRISMMEAKGASIIQFQETDYAGAQWFGSLLKYLIDKRTIQFNYQPFGKEVRKITALPLFIKEYNQRWFLLALEKESRNYQNYALDRIVSLPLPAEAFASKEYVPSPDSFFKNMIGVSPEGSPETIQIKVSKSRAPYIQTKRWHSSQTEIEVAEEFTIFQWVLIPNRELKAKILELGSDAEVLASEELRIWIKNEIQSLFLRYQN